MTRIPFALIAMVLAAADLPAPAEESFGWVGPVQTGTIAAGDEVLFSYELRQTDPLKVPVLRELIVCRPRGELIRILMREQKTEYALELGYHSRVKPVEPEVYIGPIPTRNLEPPRDPREFEGFAVPMTKLRAGAEELDFFVFTDFFVPTVQRWLEETWSGASPDIRQALNDVLVASKFVPFGMGEELTSILGIVPRTELKGYTQETKLRRVERCSDFCSGP